VPGNVSETKLDALTRPFPRAIAGIPISWRLDHDRGVLTLSYRSSAGGETEVWVPDRWAPNGYEVQVRGARVVSDPGEQGMLLRAAAGTAVVADVRRR